MNVAMSPRMIMWKTKVRITVETAPVEGRGGRGREGRGGGGGGGVSFADVGGMTT